MEDAWTQIGEDMKSDPKKLKAKWRNYRTVFLRFFKAGAKSKNDYYLMDEMKFLGDYIKVSVPINEIMRDSHATTTSNEEYTIVELPSQASSQERSDIEMYDDKMDSDSEDEPAEYVKPTSTRSRSFRGSTTEVKSFVQLENTTEPPPPSKPAEDSNAAAPKNPRDLFFMSIGPELEKLTDKQFRKFRKLCLDFIDDCEDENA